MCFIVVLDLTSKALVKSFLMYDNPVHILGSFLRFTYVKNSGIAFGILDQTSHTTFIFKNILLAVLVLVVVFFIIREIRKEKNSYTIFALYMIMGGALGNMIERVFGYIIYDGKLKLFYGQVTDFIDFGIGNVRWYYFNLADSCISIGVTLIIIRILFVKKDQKSLER